MRVIGMHRAGDMPREIGRATLILRLARAHVDHDEARLAHRALSAGASISHAGARRHARGLRADNRQRGERGGQAAEERNILCSSILDPCPRILFWYRQ